MPHKRKGKARPANPPARAASRKLQGLEEIVDYARKAATYAPAIRQAYDAARYAYYGSRRSTGSGARARTSRQSRARSVRVDSAPVAVSAPQRSRIRASPSSGRRVANSELVASIVGSTDFAVTKFTINPGLLATFPWLSTSAVQYQQYRFHRLAVRYVTRAPTSSTGSVIISPDYTASDDPPATETIASNTQDAIEDSTWKEITCRLDCRAMYATSQRKLVRAGNLAGDMQLYDSARVYVCTIGQADDSTVIGKLWLDYDVEFFIPQDSSLIHTNPTVTSEFTLDSAHPLTSGVGVDLGWLFGELPDPLGIGPSLDGVNFTPPPGCYRVTFYASMTDNTAETFSGDVHIHVNGNDLDHPATQGFKVAGVAGAKQPVTVSAVVPVNAGDKVTIFVVLTGAAGTLTVAADTRILWTLA